MSQVSLVATQENTSLPTRPATTSTLQSALTIFQGPATEKQQEVRALFKRKQKAVADWLRANRPVNGRPATEAYHVALALKYRYKFSSINQVIYKYLNDDLQVVLPNSGNDADEGGLGA